MPKFEINYVNTQTDSNKVLLLVPQNKSFISKPGFFKPQSKQKGGTCWYYVFNYLRIRYGKDFNPQTHPKRRDEIVLSTVRKKQSWLSFCKFFYNDVINSLHKKNNDAKIDKQCLKKYWQEILDEFPLAKGELPKFMDQDEIVYFEDYINNALYENHIKSFQVATQQFGIDLEIALPEFIRHYHYEEVDMQNEDEINKFILVVCRNLICHEAIKRYNLRASSWHPKDYIEVLISELRTKGPCAVGGYFHPASRTCEPHAIIEEDLLNTSRKCLGWNKNEFMKKTRGMVAHEILIIGASKEGDDENVYYIDPDRPNNVMFKMPYEKLKENISNIYGQSCLNTSNVGINGPFALHGDPRLNYLEEIQGLLEQSNISIDPAFYVNLIEEHSQLNVASRSHA